MPKRTRRPPDSRMVDLTNDIGSWVEPAPGRRRTPGWAWALIVVLVIALVAASAYLASEHSKAKPLPLTGNAARLTASLKTLNQEVTELNNLLATVVTGTETYSDSLSAASPSCRPPSTPRRSSSPRSMTRSKRSCQRYARRPATTRPTSSSGWTRHSPTTAPICPPSSRPT